VALHELGLAARNLVAAGDAENDHALLDAAEYSVAVANAIPTLKAAADRVTREPYGDGVLEVIADLIDSDLARVPPARQRRALLIGKDATGVGISLPPHGVSMLVTGGTKCGKSALTKGVLERLCGAGYQFCVLDGRGEYLDFEPAVVFGTREHAPDPVEIFTALAKPEVQAVVCLAAIAPGDRAAFFRQFGRALQDLRETTGRPHWLVADEALELVPRGGGRSGDEEAPRENTIYVTSNPAALADSVLAAIDVVAACGTAARQSLEAFAAALPSAKALEALHAPGEGQALVWFRRSGNEPALVTIARSAPPHRPMRADVGKLLRRA
jgi:hypothetical protein